MKRLFIPIMMAVLLTACGHRAASPTGADPLHADSTAYSDSTLVFNADSSAYSDSTLEVKVSFDYPVAGPQPLVDSLRAYIFRELGIGDDSDDATYAMRQQLAKEWRELPADLGMRLSYDRSITLLHGTTQYVTLLSVTDEFHGGAHGSHTCYGVTFSKQDGRRLDSRSLFTAPADPKLQALLKEAVRSYFADNSQEAATDAELKELLIGVDDVNRMPLPQYPPYLTADGLAFIYQQYEIAPYAAGLPSFILPYNKIRPFLTKEALSLIE